MPEFPIGISFGETKLLLHQVTEVLAYVAGGIYYRAIRAKSGDTYSDLKRLGVLIAAAMGALIGSRLAGVLENPAVFAIHFANPEYWIGNKSVIGGFVGGILMVELAKAIIKEHRPSGDIYVFPLLLALTIGRIGCFSMGVAENTFGYPTTFPFGTDLGDGLMRHPLMLYEIGFLAIIWLFLWIFRTRISQVPGLLFKFLMINYLIFRFFIEFLKPDINVLWGLSTLQIFCLVGLISYLPWFITQVYPNARKGLRLF